jgi:hypothetical protein
MGSLACLPITVHHSAFSMIRVYIASKIKYAARFRKLRHEWKKHNIELHARWFDQAQLEDIASPEDFHVFWLVDQHDVKTSNILIVYGEQDDHLRGALVEVGIAIAHNIPVIIVGDSPSFGTWRHHPCCIEASSLEYARIMIQRLFA